MNIILSKIKTSLFILLFFLINNHGFTQSSRSIAKSIDPGEADEHFSHRNYLMAMPLYKELIRQEKDNYEYCYKLGICYLRTHLNKAEATQYFEKAVKAPKPHPDAWLDLGRSYHIQHKFDKAIDCYKKFLELPGAKEKDKALAELYMTQCENGKQIIKDPIKVTFTNLGPQINSITSDYFPFVTADEQLLFFTSRRKGGHATQVESDGYYSSDCFMASVADGKWDKAKNLGSSVNTNLDEEIVGLRPDASELIIYIDHIDVAEDLYRSVKKNNNYGKLEKLSENVNDEKEYSGTIFNTEEGPILFFVRKDKSGFGETDIYTAKQLPNGKWGKPVNLGSNINTKYHEDFPFLSSDGKTLFFSSEGHTSIGGFDLFKSTWDETSQTWSKPENLGYPLNTADDEEQICMLPDNHAGYISTFRPEGLGDLDIYRVVFDDQEKKQRLFTGFLSSSDTTQKILNANVSVLNNKTNEEFVFKPNPKTGHYILSLAPGEYKINIKCEGHEPLNEDLIIYDLSINRPEIEKNYTLQKSKN